MTDQYIVSARKYRPDTFASIVGQRAMATTLKTAVLNGRMAHAYLFCGPRGVGKTTAARVLAKTINCLTPTKEGEACNQCESCQAFNEGRSFNIFELDAASNNSVEDIRSLIEQVSIAPVLGKYKVYIIDEVHMLSQAAFNAFLKTLEEPPSYAIFILATTEKHKILPTILSRCQTYDFKRITVSDIAQHLRYVATQESIEADDAALGLIAEKADGGMRDALSMFDRVASYGQGRITYQEALDCLNVLDYSYYIRFIQAFVSGDYKSVLLTLDELLAKGFDGQLVMAGLASFARDLLVVQHADTLSLLEKPETVQALYQEASRLVAPSALHQIIKLLVDADSKYRAATSKRLLIELTFLNILTAFQPTALGAAPQVPSPQVQPAVPTPIATSVQEAPQPQVQTQPASVADSQPTASTQVVQTPQVQTAPKPIVTPRPSQGEHIRQARRQFRQRNKDAEQAQGEDIPLAEGHEAFTQTEAQEAYVRYVETFVPDEQIILKKTLNQVLPSLVEPLKLELALTNNPALLEPAEALLPNLQRYIQSELKNTDLVIVIRPIDVEHTHVPVTNREKYEELERRHPILERLREDLSLRVM